MVPIWLQIKRLNGTKRQKITELYRLKRFRRTITEKVHLQSLFHEHHFLQQMVCAGQLVYGEQDIADVKRDVAAIVRVEFDVAHRAFPYAVEIQTDQVSVLVYHRTS